MLLNAPLRVLVTGGAGYVGSHTVLRLLPDHEVVVLDNLSRGHAELVPAQAALWQLDLRDRASLLTFFRTHRFDAVLHFAALAYVGESMLHPGLYFENNVAGTQNLLDAMVAGNVRQFVFSSTCSVYGIPNDLPIRETHPTTPVNAYGESKAAVERMLPWYQRAHGLRFVALRYFNAAGADLAGRTGEWHDPEPHLVPNVLSAAATGAAFEIYGTDYPTPDGTCVRDYIHVTDLAEAHYAALRYLGLGGASLALNLGSGHGISVKEMVEQAEAVTQRRIQCRVVPRRAGDPPALVADPSQAWHRLNWKAQHSTPTAILESAWAWHQRPRQQRSVAAASTG